VSQVNVNTPGDNDPAPVTDGSGYGMIVGILLAVLVIGLLLWLLVFNNPDDDGNGDPEPDPSAYHLVHRA
jgi:hypothetical protein